MSNSTEYCIFGYGSLIWKPPPHAIERIPGYIKGFSRRFAQSSHDHRGTPEAPGRVVTLVRAQDWHALPHADTLADGDNVWGVAYRIDPAHAEEVRAYLDHREKDGYSILQVDVCNVRGGEELVVAEKATVYVGLRENPSFVGPELLEELAATIARSEGPSGKNADYLFELHRAVKHLDLDSQDVYLDELSEAVQQLVTAI